MLLNMELVQVQRVQAAFVPTVVEGDLIPESDKGGHLIELSEEEAERRRRKVMMEKRLLSEICS